MKEEIQSYIDACNSNIEKYMHIEDEKERERVLNAIYVMKAELEKTLDAMHSAERENHD